MLNIILKMSVSFLKLGVSVQCKSPNICYTSDPTHANQHITPQICGENEALRQALSSLGHDPMQFVQNVEMPNCVYSNTVKLPKLDSCQVSNCV